MNENSDSISLQKLEQVGILMNKLKMTYFNKEDVLYLLYSEGPQSGSLELTPDITRYFKI